MALTATVTKSSRKIFCKSLDMKAPFVISKSPNRSNIHFRVSSRNFTLGWKLTDYVAIGHGEGEGAGGGCAPSRAERERKFYLFLEDSLLANSPQFPILY